jgi:AhpD family alkylhydroperoxidase
MGVVQQVRSLATVLPAGRRNRYDLLRWLRHRPQILTATAAYEMALVGSARMDPRLKQLAELKAAALVTCEFCLDIGSALATTAGITGHQLRELPRFADSDAFSTEEKLVLEFAEAMSRTPAEVPAELRDRLLRRFSPAQLTELAAAVAWENNRGRLNQALGVQPAGFSDGAACAIPER